MAAVLLLGEFHLGNDIFLSLLGRKTKITSEAADERITGTKEAARREQISAICRFARALGLSTPESIEIIEKNNFHLQFFPI